MRSPIGRRIIRPKFSTMPRQQNHANAYLQIYQLAVEKNRLQQELTAIEERKFNISKRLELIAQEIDSLEKEAHEMYNDSSGEQMDSTQPQNTQSHSQSQSLKKSEPKNPNPGYNLETMTLDY